MTEHDKTIRALNERLERVTVSSRDLPGPYHIVKASELRIEGKGWVIAPVDSSADGNVATLGVPTKDLKMLETMVSMLEKMGRPKPH